MSDDGNPIENVSNETEETTPSAPQDVFVPSINEKNARELMSAYHAIEGKDVYAEQQRQALFLLVLTNRNLGNFNIDQSAGLLNTPAATARKWSKGELGEVIRTAQANRLMQAEGSQLWRKTDQFDEALQDLGIIPRTKPPRAPDTISEPDAKPRRSSKKASADDQPSDDQTEEETQPVIPILREKSADPVERAQEFTAALEKLLTPNGDGKVIFGAGGEALYISQIENLHAAKTEIANGETLMHGIGPGGSGKGRIGIVLAYAMNKCSRNSLYVVPSQQALEDFVAEARTLCPDLDIGAVYQGEKSIGRFTYITYASLLRRILGEDALSDEIKEQLKVDAEVAQAYHEGIPLPENSIKIDPAIYDLVVWDEAHSYLTANAQALLARFKHVINIGLTASPYYYQGKEVALVFGKKYYELDWDTALERGEVCDAETILINTDIVTGIELDSPNQEESAKVARALNRPDRNKIFAEIYRDYEITVERKGIEKTYPIAGRKIMVFVTSIEHVNDAARDINEVLMHDLKNNPAFRQKLINVGIDPDAVKQAAVPHHTGGQGKYTAMDREQRKAAIAAYDAREALMLVTTRGLQQSFNNPDTSGVIDGVPRETFVGAGQAGMRATRPKIGKEMAFVFNTEDADRTTVTFDDFRASRGRGEGVAVEVGAKTGKPRFPKDSGERSDDIAGYNLICGQELRELSAKRTAARNSIYRNDSESRFFTTEGYAQVAKLLNDLAIGQEQYLTPFIEIITPWIDRVASRMSAQSFPKEARASMEGEIHDAITDSLMVTLQSVRSGSIALWSRFQQRFSGALERRFEIILKRQNQSTDEVSFSSLKSNERKRDLVDMEGVIERKNVVEALPVMLRKLNPDERAFIKNRYINGMTAEETATDLKLSIEEVQRIKQKALKRLRDPKCGIAVVEEWMCNKKTALEIAYPSYVASEDMETIRVLENIESRILRNKASLKVKLTDSKGTLLPAVLEQANCDPDFIGGLEALIQLKSPLVKKMKPVLTREACSRLMVALDKVNAPNETSPKVVRQLTDSHRRLCIEVAAFRETWKKLAGIEHAHRERRAKEQAEENAKNEIEMAKAEELGCPRDLWKLAKDYGSWRIDKEKESESRLLELTEAQSSEIQKILLVLSCPRLLYDHRNKVVSLVEMQPLENQKEILIAAAGNLASHQDERLNYRVIELVKRQPLDAQKEILSAPNFISDFSYKSSLDEIMRLIENQPQEGRQEILLAESAVRGLAYRLAHRIIPIIEELPLDLQKMVLVSAADVLVEHGGWHSGKKVVELLMRQPPVGLEEICHAYSNRYSLTRKLREYGLEKEVDEIKKARVQSRKLKQKSPQLAVA